MISKRARNLKPSPTLALAAKAKELASQGHDVISLSVGEPDWDTFAMIKAAGIQAIESGQTKYAPANGLPQLRTAIAEFTSKDLGVEYKPTQVTVTAGGKMSIFAALQVLLDPGDEAIIPAPYWVSYPTMVELADAVPQIVQCSKDTRFKLSWENLSKALTPKTKLVFLNSPSNPTGEVHSRSELEAIAKVLRTHPNLVLLSDDIYNRLIFTGERLAPHILHVAPDLKDRVVVINGASKTYAMTGWRLGWALGPQPVIDAMTNYQSQSVSCASPFTQLAAVEGLLHGDSAIREAVAVLKGRRDRIHAALRDLPGIDVQLPDGAFYLWPDISSFFGKSIGGRKLNDSKDFAQALLEDQMVAVVPGIEFGLEGHLRLSFVADEKKVLEAVKRIRQFINKLH